MAQVLNGVPLLISPGEWVGAEDFRDAAVGAGLPDGITVYTGVSGNTFTVEEVVDDGGSIGKNIHSNNLDAGLRLMYGIDAFDGLVGSSYEILALVRMGSSGGSAFANRKCLGPATNQSGAGATFSLNCYPLQVPSSGGSQPVRTGLEFIVDGGGNPSTPGGIAVTATPLDFTAPAAAWVWVRTRKNIKASNPLLYEIKAKIWPEGTAEPAGWGTEIEYAIAQDPINTLPVVLGPIGFGVVNTSWDGPDYGCAFFSFSTDPLSEPPPTSSDIIASGDILAPTVTITELQADFVIATGSAFEVVA